MLDNDPSCIAPPQKTRRMYHLIFWSSVVLGMFSLLYVLRSVLSPFVAGMIMAYLLDPLADRLERWKISRGWATIIITLGFLIILVIGLLILLPVLQNQIASFVVRAPNYAKVLVNKGHLIMAMLQDVLEPEEMARITDFIGDIFLDATRWLTRIFSNLVSGGMMLVGIIAVLVVVPVITFYMLRDWERMVAVIDRFLPRPYAPVIRQQMGLMDQTIAGFIRGQFLVCVILGSFYGIALSLAGLDLAMVVGLTSGILSFIPYVGTITGFVMSMGLAFAQFSEWSPILTVLGIFVFGQVVESYYLTPKLVGDRVGLHPVWVMFALLAGAGLFGFVGVLLAVPVAAAIGVLVRFFLGQYIKSPLYTGVDEHGFVVTKTFLVEDASGSSIRLPDESDKGDWSKGSDP